MTETVSHTVTPEIYGKSGDISKHLDGVKKQYDTAEKRDFYAQVMGDGKFRPTNRRRFQRPGALPRHTALSAPF